MFAIEHVGLYIILIDKLSVCTNFVVNVDFSKDFLMSTNKEDI